MQHPWWQTERKTKMNEIRTFENTEFGFVRTIIVNGEVMFVGKDVADILGYQNGSRDINRHVDDEDKLTERIVLSGQNREVILINESGLYSLVLSRKMPNAKKFKRWVTSEVLPAIRKHGSYGEINLEELIAKTATAVAVEVTKQLMKTMQQEIKPVKPIKKIAKKYKYTTPSKISTLPPEVKEHVDGMLRSGNYSCQSVANFIINSTGMYISQMAVNRYKRSNFEIIDSEI